MVQHPLIPLVLSIILLLLMIKQSLTRKKFLKFRMILSFLLAFVCSMLLAFESEITKTSEGKDILGWALLALDIFIGLCFILFSELSASREQFNLDLFHTLDETKYYLLIDKKNRIKEISSLFLQDLELSKEQVIRKNFLDVIEKKYRIFKINGTDYNKKDVHIFFLDAQTKEAQLNFELHDDHGDISAYYFNETPIMVLGRFRGRILIGDKKDSSNLIGMERNLAESTEELELIKSRFMTILDRTKEGIFFADLKNKSIWVNSVLTHDLYLNDNTLSLEDFHKNIHPDDLEMYKARIAQVNNINPNYSVTYRFNVGNRYIYLKEEGSRISDGHTIELCGLMSVLDSGRYEKTQTELDQVLGEAELLAAVDQLYQKGKTFEVVRIQVSSIPEMNARYGRNVGNIALSEYIKLIKQRYVDSNMIYRLSGLEFIAVVTDYRKMELLKNNLNNNEKILHVSADYGNVHTKIEACMGICYSSDAVNAKDALNKTKECIKYSTNPQFNANFVYYKNIR